ncbi:hypothetical protein QCA50_002562 [Cerrena zonata]|uniref:Uncharacterized protein n=1 Tax=Cerrena zonata TaxID=2478898 RepID=A0AAW0GSV5_9APHY
MAYQSKRTYRCITLLEDEETVCWKVVSFPQTRCSAHREQYSRLARECLALSDKVHAHRDKLTILRSPEGVDSLKTVKEVDLALDKINAIVDVMGREIAMRKSQHVRYCAQGVVDHHSVYIRDLETEKLDVLEFRNMLSLKRETLVSPVSSSQSRGYGYNDPPPGYTFYDQRGIPCQERFVPSSSTPLIHAGSKNGTNHGYQSITITRDLEAQQYPQQIATIYVPPDDADDETCSSIFLNVILFLVVSPYLLVGLGLYGIYNLLKWVYDHIVLFFLLFIIMLCLMIFGR